MIQIGLVILVFTILIFRSIAMKRLFGKQPRFSWISIYYLFISAMLIFALPIWSALFILGFPLLLLDRHVKAMRELRASNAGLTLASYRTKLAERQARRSTRMYWLRTNLSVFFSLLVVAEFGLALAGYQPGMIVYSSSFVPVDTLREYDGYEADEQGILHVNKEARNFNQNYIKRGELGSNLMLAARLNYVNHHYTPYSVGWDFLEAMNDSPPSNFHRFYKNLQEKKSHTSLDSAYLAYCNSPINADGFRSIAFENHQTKHKKVLLLGDSFTWGDGTDNMTSSFADELSYAGFAVYNSGIIGVGMHQYAAIAERYGPVVQPNVVVVNVFLGNDIVEHRIQLKPFAREYFNTNAGTLMAAPHGKYVYTAQEAYDRIMDQSTIPKKASAFNWLCSQTRISTLIWDVLKVANCLSHTQTAETKKYWKFVNSTKIGYQVNFDRLAEIKATCEKLNCRMIVSIIPEWDKLDISKAEISKQLAGFPYVMMHGLTAEDYASCGHFNDQGHRKYAKFLAKQIEGISK